MLSNSLFPSVFQVEMVDLMDEVTLTSIIPPIKQEILVEECVTANILRPESLFATDYTDVHIEVRGLIGATMTESDWGVFVPN